MKARGRPQAHRTWYSGRRRSKAHARASSQWKVPLCVPIRGGAMRLQRGRLEGWTHSRLCTRCRTRRGGGGNNKDRSPRGKRHPMQLLRCEGGSAEPEKEVPAQPHFRPSAFPTAPGPAQRKGLPAPPGVRRSLQGKPCIRLWGGAHSGPLPSHLFTSPLLMQE